MEQILTQMIDKPTVATMFFITVVFMTPKWKNAFLTLAFVVITLYSAAILISVWKEALGY